MRKDNNLYGYGFTLAEILITLVIIGVVSVLTIPVLLANMTGARYRSQFKKAVSTLSQAVRMNKANYGWDFADVNIGCGSKTGIQTHNAESDMSVCAIMNSNLSAKQGFYRESTLGSLVDYEFNGTTVGVSNQQYTVYSLADGTLVGFRSVSFSRGCSLKTGENLSKLLQYGSTHRSDSSSFHKCTGFIDVNGFSLPNEETLCSIGTTSFDFEEDCTVKNKDIKDIFPIVFHDSIVEGATNAARYVLQTAK